MKKSTLYILFFFTTLFSEEMRDSYIIPAVTTHNTGVERMWVWSGISGGFLLGNNRIGGELYYWNHDESIPGSTLQNRLQLFGTLYGHWEYQFSPLPFVTTSAGISLGYQYAEVDKNWDSTFIGNYLTEDNSEQFGTVPLNWEAEAKVQSFGGPQFSLGLGWRRAFLHTRFRLNMGYYKRWGGYKSNDPSVIGIDCGDGLRVGEVSVSESGWQKSSGGVLETGFQILPEWQFGLLIFL